MKKNEFVIQGRKIGIDQTPYCIAEVGINHNGSLEKALEMISVAKKAGADAVKFQTFKAREMCGDPNQLFTYKSQGKTITEPMVEMFLRNELTHDDWFAIKKQCISNDIVFFSTPQNFSDLEFLLKIGVPAIKIGSDDFTNLPLLESYSEVGLPLIVSSGMADMAEVYTSLNTIGAFKNKQIAILQCTSQYPTRPKDVNLKRIRTLKSAFPMVEVGFSDHTQGALASSLAVAMGASIFEKHFTLDNNLPGPDHWFSENPVGLEKWINSIKTSWDMMGDPIIRPTQEEHHMKNISRRSIVAIKDIKNGSKFTKNNIAIRRPGTGLPPDMYEKVLNCKTSVNLKEGDIVVLGNITKF